MKIHEILHKFPNIMSDPEFYAHFYQKPTVETQDDSDSVTTSPSRDKGVFV
jgi:hypothetical protein